MILLVEDNPRDARFTLRALRKGNVCNCIEVVADGAEALDYLFARGAYAQRDVHDLPTVVLLDLQLPKIDGLEVLRQVRADPRTHLLPVVILTGSEEEKDKLSSYQLGANSFICKPVGIDDSSKAVVQLGLYWMILNQSANQQVKEDMSSQP
jgi:two-component system response regulator